MLAATVQMVTFAAVVRRTLRGVGRRARERHDHRTIRSTAARTRVTVAWCISVVGIALDSSPDRQPTGCLVGPVNNEPAKK